MTPAERLLAAADLLDKRAGEATEGPWCRWRDIQPQGFCVVGDEQGVLTDERPFTEECNPVANIYIDPDATYIATMHPEVGKALAESLRGAGLSAGQFREETQAQLFQRDLAVADALLAGAS